MQEEANDLIHTTNKFDIKYFLILENLFSIFRSMLNKLNNDEKTFNYTSVKINLIILTIVGFCK